MPPEPTRPLSRPSVGTYADERMVRVACKVQSGAGEVLGVQRNPTVWCEDCGGDLAQPIGDPEYDEGVRICHAGVLV